MTIPVAFVKQQGVVTLTHTARRRRSRRRPAPRTARRRVANFGSVAGERQPDGDEPRQGQGPRLHEHLGAGDRDQEGRRRPVERHPDPGDPAAGRRRSRRHRRRARPAATCRCRCFGIAPIAGVGDDTITNFNVPTFYYGGEPYTRDRRRLERLRRDRRRHAADIVLHPQTFPNPARPNNVVAPFWTDLNPAGAAARSAIGTLTDGVGHLARRRLGGGEELQQRDDAHRSRSGSELDPARRHRPVERADHDLVRRRERRRRRSRAPASTGAPRTVTARAARTSPPAPGERHASASVDLTAADGRWDARRSRTTPRARRQAPTGPSRA